MRSASTDMTTYRWSRAQVIRVVGLVVVLLGLLWLVVAAVAALGGPGLGSMLRLVAAGLTVLGLAAAVWLVVRPPAVLQLSATGYRVFRLGGGGVPAAEWSDVQSVRTQASTEGSVIVVELSGGRTSLVPASVLGLRATDAQREMHDRLNSAFGYRRLDKQPGLRR